MNKQLSTDDMTITFTHSLPLQHVLAYLRTAASLRRSARESLEMATRYDEGVRMRTWLEAIAKKELGRADAVEHLVTIMARQPPAKPFVVDYMGSVLHPGRSGEDLEAFAGEVERDGMRRVEEMALYGFMRPGLHDISLTRATRSILPTAVFLEPENTDEDSDDKIRERAAQVFARISADHKYSMCCAGQVDDESKNSR